MLVSLKDMIEEDQSYLYNEQFYTKQDTTSIEI